MAKRRFRAEEIVTVLRQVEVACPTARPHHKPAGSEISEQTYKP